jgi:lysophospholipase L1-like esterase
MIRASHARWVAAKAAYGGGGLGLLGALGVALLFAEARVARRVVGVSDGVTLDPDGRYGTGDSPPLRFAVLGDSCAAGLGVTEIGQTPGAILAEGLSRAAGRPVDLRSVARSGARSTDLDDQVLNALPHQPDVALILIGGNDVTHRVPPATAIRHLIDAVVTLRAAGAEVLVATCPDLGTIRPIGPPLRQLARHRSRALAAAQTVAVIEHGGTTVSLGDLLGPEFAARPQEMFGPDRFHPSVAGYAAAAAVMLPALCSLVVPDLALPTGLPDAEARELDSDDHLRPVAQAAVEAVDRPGTEVVAVTVGGRERGPRGRWALLRRLARRTDVASPAAAGT